MLPDDFRPAFTSVGSKNINEQKRLPRQSFLRSPPWGRRSFFNKLREICLDHNGGRNEYFSLRLDVFRQGSVERSYCEPALLFRILKNRADHIFMPEGGDEFAGYVGGYDPCPDSHPEDEFRQRLRPEVAR